MYIGLLIAQIVLGVVLFQMILGLIAYLILLERKTAAWIQDRLGPNRVGPQGLLQPIADGVKFILKEEFIPAAADKGLFLLAPLAIMTPAMCGFAVIPWAGELSANSWFFGYQLPFNWPVMVANPSIGVLFVIAMAGLATYGVVLGGYASGSKYSFLGGLRATAQMLSYEIPMALAIMAAVLVVGSLNLSDVVNYQAAYFNLGGIPLIPKWNAFVHPLAFLIFITCIFAESNRTPFDLAECESELVGGYHTEYSSMKFAMFFLAEYGAMLTGSAVCVALFLGGWHLPWLDLAVYGVHNVNGVLVGQPVVAGWAGVALKFVVFWGKVVAFLFFYMWVRWTLPRFRFDQLMNLAWRGMIPMSLGAFLIAAVAVFIGQLSADTPGSPGNWTSLWIFLGNLVFFGLWLSVVARLPRNNVNRRIAIPGSRYNPQLAAPRPSVA